MDGDRGGRGVGSNFLHFSEPIPDERMDGRKTFYITEIRGRADVNLSERNGIEYRYDSHVFFVLKVFSFFRSNSKSSAKISTPNK